MRADSRSGPLRVIDSHTCGMPTRVVIGGVQEIPGLSHLRKRRYFQKHFDSIRTMLMQEPRGNAGVCAVILSPSDKRADFGVIFGDYRGYVDMCIHGTIGLVTTLFQYEDERLGRWIENKLKNSSLVIETASGLISASPNFERSRLVSVSVSNVPSIFLGTESVETKDFGRLSLDIAFGGNIYAYVNSEDLGLPVKSQNLGKLLKAGDSILNELEYVGVSHPTMKNVKGILGVSIYEDFATKCYSKNIMIAKSGLFDRSPCGTGTCGRMAVLHSMGRLNPSNRFRSRSIIDSEFVGRIIKETKVGGLRAILPEVTGSAYLTGVTEVMISPDDPLAKGFLVA